jgi:hypothetical protein
LRTLIERCALRLIATDSFEIAAGIWFSHAVFGA